MVASLAATARSLWRQAPYWRFSVIGAAGFTVLSLIYLWSGEDVTATTSRPVVTAPRIPADPASDARLSDYETAYGAVNKLPAAGARCEPIAGAFDGLTADDVKRGRSVVIASASRIKAVAAGEACHTDIGRSDQHFAAVRQAVTAASQPNASPQQLQAAADAPKMLDTFDRSRPRYEADAPVIGRAQGIAADLAASDARIRTLGTDADTYETDHSAPLALRAAESLGRLTAFDRGRLTGTQQASFERASEAARLIQESRSRLSRLGRLLSTAQTSSVPDAQEKLIDGVAAITAFDQNVATTDQKQTIEQARKTALSYAWSIARERVAALGSEQRADRLRAASSIYTVLKDVPPGTLSPEQKQTLGKLQDAVDALAASDTRLSALNDAFSAWQQRGIAAGDAVTDAVGAITPLDRGRFDEGQRKAMAALVRADQIVRGPELGFTAETKDRLPILVQPAGDSATDNRMAISLATALRRAGFPIAAIKTDAALTVSVGFKGSDGLKQDLSSGFFAWVTTAHAAYALSWVADGSIVVGGEVAQSGRSQDQTAVQSQALLADVDAIVSRIQSKLGK